ncbi:MAG TPA: acyltransferase family protein, partial [Telluria sp.]|nr:acyltransferase family protein [Telluria sp.]
MWLGIVLHTAINHTTGPSPLPWRDSQTSPVADLILIFIHAFRMPVFFVLAGYFVALLVASRGYRGMLAHRMRGLALPFAIFWPILIVCTTLLMALYLHLMAYGTAGIDLSLLKGKGAKPASPFNTMHMWFIYYLIWFCALTALFGPVAQRATEKVQQTVDSVFRALATRWWGLVLLTLPLAITGSFYRAGMLSPNGSFIPNLNELVHNGAFFVFGLFMYRHQDYLFPRFAKSCWRNAAIGFVVFILALG